jgi:hypothetical protein
VGLVKYGAERLKISRFEQHARPVRTDKRFHSRIGEWFREVF